jgi:hypothetical protein
MHIIAARQRWTVGILLRQGDTEAAMELLEREETGQVMLTAPKASDVRFRGDALPRWRIASGRITA